MASLQLWEVVFFLLKDPEVELGPKGPFDIPRATRGVGNPEFSIPGPRASEDFVGCPLFFSSLGSGLGLRFLGSRKGLKPMESISPWADRSAILVIE